MARLSKVGNPSQVSPKRKSLNKRSVKDRSWKSKGFWERFTFFLGVLFAKTGLSFFNRFHTRSFEKMRESYVDDTKSFIVKVFNSKEPVSTVAEGGIRGRSSSISVFLTEDDLISCDEVFEEIVQNEKAAGVKDESDLKVLDIDKLHNAGALWFRLSAKYCKSADRLASRLLVTSKQRNKVKVTVEKALDCYLKGMARFAQVKEKRKSEEQADLKSLDEEELEALKAIVALLGKVELPDKFLEGIPNLLKEHFYELVVSDYSWRYNPQYEHNRAKIWESFPEKIQHEIQNTLRAKLWEDLSPDIKKSPLRPYKKVKKIS